MAGFGASVVAAGVLLALRTDSVLSSLWSQMHRALDPTLRETPPGALGENAVRTLLATTEALVGTEIDRSHYEGFFRWRAENVLGYRDLYERFTLAVGRAANEKQHADFADCDIAARGEILRNLKRERYPRIFSRDAVRYEKYIVKYILWLFSATDAWILLGYPTWPGIPRGLDSYTRAPS